MKTNSNSKTNVLFLTELALLTAIVILMAFTPLGYLKIGAQSITFIVVPVAVGAVLLGVKGGAFLGLVFGLTSFVQCFGMDAFGTMIFGMKPIATAFCCIAPRILVGVVPALVFKALKKINCKKAIAIAVSCVCAPLTNTLLYLGCMTVFFKDILINIYGYAGSSGFFFLIWLLALVSVNVILETASSLILGSAISMALIKTFNKNK